MQEKWGVVFENILISEYIDFNTLKNSEKE